MENKYIEHQDTSQLTLLESEVQNLQSRNNTLSAQVFYLESDNEALRSRLRDLEKEHSDLKATLGERKLHTSEVEAINRSNRRRIYQLEEDISSLRNSHKTREWVKDTMHFSEVDRLKEESVESLQSQESMFKDAIDKMQAESDVVARGLREESRDKTELFKMALEFAQEVQASNLQLTACVAAQLPEYFSESQNGHSRKLAILDKETGDVEALAINPSCLTLTELEDS